MEKHELVSTCLKVNEQILEVRKMFASNVITSNEASSMLAALSEVVRPLRDQMPNWYHNTLESIKQTSAAIKQAQARKDEINKGF